MSDSSDGTICSVGDVAEFVGGLPVRGAWSHWWFLGHADASWDPVPSVLRGDFLARRLPAASGGSEDAADRQQELLTAEQDLNREFRIRSAYLLPADLDLVAIYFVARHHGLPSRLLDWTENPLLALFLAVVDRPDRDGEILVATPEDFQPDGAVQESPEDKRLFADARTRAVRNTIEFLFGERPEDRLFEQLDFNEPRILPIIPDQRRSRLVRQGARFTLHMPGCPVLSKEALRRQVIPSAAKHSIRQELRKLAIRWDTFFPDLDHVARELAEM
jgi:hypothetical protein